MLMMALLDFSHVCFVMLFVSLPKPNQTPAQIYRDKGPVLSGWGGQRTNMLPNEF